MESIKVFEPVSGKTLERREEIFIYPAKHYLVDEGEFERGSPGIEREMEERVNFFPLRGAWWRQGIEEEDKIRPGAFARDRLLPGNENYSRHLDGRSPGEPPYTLLDYFPS